jgi:hypothetical protein
MLRRCSSILRHAALWLTVAASSSSLATGAGDPVPALRLVTLADGSLVFLNGEDEVVGILTDTTEATDQAQLFSAPPQLLGWPLRVGEVESTPTVADIDADGRLEVAFASRDAHLYVMRFDGSFQSGWPFALQSGSLRTPSVVDVDGDGALDVFLAALSIVYGVGPDGVSLPGWPQVGSGFAGTTAEDLDGDGVVEIASMGRDGQGHLFDPLGDEKAGWPFVFPSVFAMSNKDPAVGDLDGDGIGEIAIPISFAPSLYLLRVDGTIQPGFPLYLTAAGLKQGVSMADVDGDGAQDLVFQEQSGVWIVDGDGRPFPGFPAPPTGGNAAPAVGDIDGDGHLEMAWGTIGGDARVFVYRDDGTLQPGWPVTVPSFTFNAQATIGDVDGDGGPDVVLGGSTATFSSRGWVYAWHADGTPLSGFPFQIPDGKSILGSAVTLTDLDQDGDVDLLVGAITGFGGTTSGGVYAFDLAAPYEPTTIEWPTEGHDVRHTSRYEPPDRAPVPDAGPDLVVECTSPEGALVVLDASASSDPDAGDEVVLFEWFEDFGLPGEVLLGTGEVVEVVLPLGEHAITLRVRDRPGARRTDSLVVGVVDTVAPAVSVGLEPEELWPPNHRLVEVDAVVAAADLCSTPAVVLESVASSEPDDAPGGEDGATRDDIQDADLGTADFGMRLRAERSGAGTGRIYQVRYRATDGAGNAAAATGGAVVPHDQGVGGGVEPVLLSAEQTAVGTLIAWDPVPGIRFYNVVRGGVGSLSDTGAVYDLGLVVCLASGAAATSTAGLEDAAVPSPGESFFYLVEYDDGRPSGYGTGSAARERVERPGEGCR